MKFKIDIILPTYNQSSLLERAVDSILNQTFLDIRLIIVNDGSTDATKDILNNYNDIKNILIIENDFNQGLPRALNIGHEHGDSMYCSWVSSDNVSLPDQFEKLFSFIHENDYDLVFSNFTKRRVVNGENNDSISNMGIKNGRLGIGSMGASFLYKRSVWEEFRYDENRQGGEDIKFFAQAKLSNKRIGHLDKNLLIYYKQKNSLSGRLGNAKIKDVVDKIGEEIGL